MTRWSRKATWVASAAALCGAAAVLLVAPAVAHHIKNINLAGQPVVGSTLTAAVELGVPAAVLEYRWQRCDTVEKSTCTRILGAPDAPSYRVANADLGKRLAVRVISDVAGVQESGWSPRTDVVTAPPPDPTPTPTPTPTPSATPTPTPTPDRDPDPPADASKFSQSSGPPMEVPATAAVEKLRFLRPFPVVRVKGTLVSGGARISLLRVKAPTEATVDARCKRKGCRVRRRSFGAGRVRALERFLRAGTRVTIRVSTPDTVGKYVRLVIRDGSPPKRRDACLLPGDGAPVACPEQ
jgi:hypothetical protein